MGKQYAMDGVRLAQYTNRDGYCRCQCCKRDIKKGERVTSTQAGKRSIRHDECIVRY